MTINAKNISDFFSIKSCFSSLNLISNCLIQNGKNKNIKIYEIFIKAACLEFIDPIALIHNPLLSFHILVTTFKYETPNITPINTTSNKLSLFLILKNK